MAGGFGRTPFGTSPFGGAYGGVTERLYSRLPEFYRDADAVQAPPDPLRRFISLVGDQASEIENLWYRLYFDQADRTGTSDLTDPATADAKWLPWLAQLVGGGITEAMAEEEMRDVVRFAVAGWRAGTKPALANAVRSALTGSRHAEVYDHSIVTPGDGGPFDILIVTGASETPNYGAVLRAIKAKRAKPAGAKLWHRSFSASWDSIEAAYPNWDAIEAAGNWRAIEETSMGSRVSPMVTVQPQPTSVVAGGTATFNVGVIGTSPLAYQWEVNEGSGWVAVAGATGATYTTPVTAITMDGRLHRVVVTNAHGTSTSDPATLTVTPAPVAPSITDHPNPATVSAGLRATFQVAAAGSEPLTYQWQHNGTGTFQDILSGANAATYITPATANADTGRQYRCRVENAAGRIISNAATLTVTGTPAIPTITGITVGEQSASVAWTNPGSTPITRVRAETRLVPGAPVITTQPQSQGILTGSSAALSVGATGTEPLAYQWQQRNDAAVWGTDSIAPYFTGGTATDRADVWPRAVSMGDGVWLRVMQPFDSDNLLLYRSTDNMRTWQVLGRFAGTGEFKTAFLHRAPNGTVLLIVANHTSTQYRITQYRSADGGFTWGASRLKKIMALGDDAVVGTTANPSGIRGPLGTKLGAHRVDFVGPNASGGTGVVGGPEHAGYAGAWIDGRADGNNLQGRVTNLITTHTPDEVLIQAGRNDLLAGQSATVTRDRLSALIDAIHTAKAGTRIILSLVAPTPDGSHVAYNDLIPGLVFVKATEGKNIGHIPATFIGYPDHFADPTNFNAEGFERQAELWHDHLTRIQVMPFAAPQIIQSVTINNVGDDWNGMWEPFVHTTADNRLVLTYADERQAESQVISQHISADNGANWGARTTIARDAKHAAVTNKALTANVATLTTSAAHGFLVNEVVNIVGIGSPFDGAYTITGVPTATTFTYAKTAADVASSAVTPNGQAAVGGNRPGMPSVARMANGRFILVYEIIGGTRNGDIYAKFSDDGVTWPAGVGTLIPGMKVAPFVQRLASGRLLLTAGMVTYENLAVPFKFSDDNGASFVDGPSPYPTLYTDGNAWGGSPAIYEADGRILFMSAERTREGNPTVLGFVDIAGAITSTYTTPPLSTTRRYRAKVSNPVATVTSAEATITVSGTATPVTITGQPPAGVTVVEGGDTYFGPTAITGTSPYSYQWQQWNGTAWMNLAGATSSQLILLNVPSTLDGTRYRVRVNNVANVVVTSTETTLTVTPATSGGETAWAEFTTDAAATDAGATTEFVEFTTD